VIPFNRIANPAPAVWNVVKTLVIVALFNAVFVWAIPAAIVSLQRESGDFDALFFPPQLEIGRGVLVAASLVVFWASMMLAIRGGGTPVPFDAPRRLVVGGPYAWLRTPMVTGTVMQGVGLTLMAGSIVVIVYFVTFALLWNTFVRPTEEDRMQSQFGRDFELYRRSVRCWLPMRTPWRRPEGETGPITLDETPDPNRRRRSKSRY